MTSSGKPIVVAAVSCFLVGACATSPLHVEPSRDIACLQRAALPLADAIEAVEKSPGQTVIDAEYNIEHELGCARGDPGHYDITLYLNGELTRATVDAQSGGVGPGHYEGLLRRMFELDVLSDWPEAEMLKGAPAARDARTTMREAVRLAEASGGKAMAAHVKTEGKTTSYVIEVVRRGHVNLAYVDLESGTVRN